MRNNSLILLLAGKSSRFQNLKSNIKDKILININNYPIIFYSLNTFINSKIINKYFLVYRNYNQKKNVIKIIKKFFYKRNILNLIKFIKGGISRQHSVFNALKIIMHYNDNTQYIFIHDAARPLINIENIKDLYHLVKKYKIVTLGKKILNTTNKIYMKKNKNNDIFNESNNRIIINYKNIKIINRNYLWEIETPQVFEKNIIIESYMNIINNNIKITDDISSVIKLKNKKYYICIKNNIFYNFKLTYYNDIILLKYLIKCFYRYNNVNNK